MTQATKPNCDRCSDDGVVFIEDLDGRRNIYRCRCPKGRALEEKIYRPSDRKHRRPLIWPLVPEEHPTGRELAAGKKED